MYLIVGGAPTYVSSWAVFGSPQAVQTISQVQFDSLAPYPVDGTFIQPPAGSVYRMAGGAPILVSAWSVFGAPQPTESIDPWDLQNTSSCLAHVLAAPADGTVVEGLPSGTYWSFLSGERSLVTASASAVPVDDVGLQSFPLAIPSTGGESPADPCASAPRAVAPPVKTCLVPRLKHMTLAAARAALTRADCRVGALRRPRHVPRRHTLHVFGQSAAPQSTQPAGTPINLWLL